MINLFINHYTDNNAKRNDELLQCLQMNINNASIDNIFCICNNEGDSPMLDSNKVSILILKSRPTYNVFFQLIAKYTKPDDWNIIANTDIYLDQSIQQIHKYSKPKTLIALTRWEVVGKEIRFLNRADSQDTWIFKGHPNVNCDFQMGTPGCDNVLAERFSRNGWLVVNPSRTIKTYHLHTSNVRNYTSNQRLMPPYKLIQPTT